MEKTYYLNKTDKTGKTTTIFCKNRTGAANALTLEIRKQCAARFTSKRFADCKVRTAVATVLGDGLNAGKEFCDMDGTTWTCTIQ